MPVNMINWPTPGVLYDDTGEGGLFAYLVVLAPERPDDPCNVDVYAYLSEPDARVPFRMAEPQIWDEGGYHDRARTRLHAARAALERADEGDLARSLTHLRGEDELSLGLRWAGFLGATSASLSNRHVGGYYEAIPDDLTPTGRAVYDALAKEYGEGDVHIITLLDT